MNTPVVLQALTGADEYGEAEFSAVLVSGTAHLKVAESREFTSDGELIVSQLTAWTNSAELTPQAGDHLTADGETFAVVRTRKTTDRDGTNILDISSLREIS